MITCMTCGQDFPPGANKDGLKHHSCDVAPVAKGDALALDDIANRALQRGLEEVDKGGDGSFISACASLATAAARVVKLRTEEGADADDAAKLALWRKGG